MNNNSSKKKTPTNHTEKYFIPFYAVIQNSVFNPMTSVQKVQMKITYVSGNSWQLLCMKSIILHPYFYWHLINTCYLHQISNEKSQNIIKLNCVYFFVKPKMQEKFGILQVFYKCWWRQQESTNKFISANFWTVMSKTLPRWVKSWQSFIYD